MSFIVKAAKIDYNTNIRLIEELMRNFSFLKAEIIGRSALSRGIFSLSLGNPKSSVLLCAGLRGNEWLSSSLLLLFTEQLCRCISEKRLMCAVDVSRAFSRLGVTLIPCLNPDGREIALKGASAAGPFRALLNKAGEIDFSSFSTNAAGVRLELNFSGVWEKGRELTHEKLSEGTSITGSAGAFPESEPEVRTVTRLCRLRRFRQCLELRTAEPELTAGHCPGAPQSTMMAKILADSAGVPFCDRPDASCTQGLQQWFARELSSPCFTLKTGKESSSLPVSSLYEIYNRIEEALLLLCLM